jgi:hypothetical protein
MKVLIGNTGLIGQTLQDYIKFDFVFNSSNINEFSEHQLEDVELYLACLPATKWKVDKDILSDLDNMYQIISIIKNRSYKKIVLFSTIDVYNNTPIYADEHSHPIITKLCYGSNRRLFELMIKELDCLNTQIYRLPALFGHRIKKNVLFDLLHNHNIDAININSMFQWFNLNRLVFTISNIDIPGTYNLFTEPIHTSELIKLFDISITNSNQESIVYNYKTTLTKSGYLQNSHEVYCEIKEFINEFRNKSSSISG